MRDPPDGIYGRGLRHIRTESKELDGYTQTVEVYGCADCSGCEHKSRCLYKYNAEKNPDRNKVTKINERWEELKEESNANIQSEEAILERIQALKKHEFSGIASSSHIKG